MRGIYGGFETWLNKYGKEITVAKNSMKILHSIIARWTSKDKRKLGKSAEPGSDESKDKEDKGHCLDKGNNLLSRTWSREEREKQKRNEDILSRTQKSYHQNSLYQKISTKSGSNLV
jgi:hypothetical protein